MGFRDWFRRRLSPEDKAELAQEVAAAMGVQLDLKLATQRKPPKGKPVEESVKNRRRSSNPVTGHHETNVHGRRAFAMDDDALGIVSPVYDLAECIKLEDIESYFALSVDRHTGLIMKQDTQIVGKNPETVAYVKKRLKEAAYVSDLSFNDILRSVVRSVVKTSNALIVFKRDPSRSSGRRTKKWGRDLDPISAFYTADVSTLSVRQTKTGLVHRWVQQVDGEKREWSVHDVVHFHWRRKDGFVFGTPLVIPVLEDIRALRKFELMTEHVGHKFAFPLLHWKVGTEKVPADMYVDPVSGGQRPEVDVAKAYLETMAQEGFVVTSERHEIKVVGAEGEKIDLQPFIDHLELRVLGGLRLSEVDIGRGDTSNKGTAQVISQNLVDECTELQQIISEVVTWKVFDALVMEGGWDLNPETEVRLVFPPIDQEERRAQETHALNMYLSGGIEQDELRGRLGLDIMNPEQEKKLFLNTHLIPLAKATAAAKAAAAGPSGDGIVSTVRVAVQPTNQYGKSQTKPRVPKNDWGYAWDKLGEDIAAHVGKPGDVRPAINQTIGHILDSVTSELYDTWTEAWRQAAQQLGVMTPAKLDRTYFDTYLKTLRDKDLKGVARVAMLTAGIDPKVGECVDLDIDRVRTRTSFEATRDTILNKVNDAYRQVELLAQLEVASVAQRPEVTLGMTDGKEELVKLQELAIIPCATNPRVKSVTAK